MKKIPSHLKKFCASAPAAFTGPPGVPTRARARLVGIRRVRFGVAAPAGRLACLCWLCCVAVGCCPAAVIGLLLPCAPLAFSCCLRPVMAPWLACCLGAVSPACAGAGWGCRAAPCWGAIGGVYIKLPGDYTGRVKLPPARLSVSLAAHFLRLRSRAWPGRVAPPLLAAGSPVCRFTCWAAPGAFGSLASVFRSSGAAPPHGMPHGKRHENFQRFPRRGIFRARSKSFFLVFLRPPIVPPRLAEINWKSRMPPRRKFS